MREQAKNSIILSAELSALSTSQNVTRSLRLSGMLEDLGVPYIPVDGVWRNIREGAFLCVPRSSSELETVVSFGLVNFSQEAILLNINEPTHGLSNGVYLCDGAIEDSVRIGSKMARVSEEQASGHEAYTFRPDNKTYWVAL